MPGRCSAAFLRPSPTHRIPAWRRHTSKPLYFTGEPEADALLAREPLALLIGFALDQQVTVQKAFSSPLELQRRIGSLDAAHIAGMDSGELEDAFCQRPALHRFPGQHGRAASRSSAVSSSRSTAAAPSGSGPRRPTETTSAGASPTCPASAPMKVIGLGSVLAKRFGVEAAEPLVPDHPTLGDVDFAEALEAYQAKKRAHKAKLRAERG